MTGTFTVINPATAAPLREVSRASVGDVDAAIVIGKFHGTMMPTTPYGSWNVTSMPPATGIC